MKSCIGGMKMLDKVIRIKTIEGVIAKFKMQI